LQFEYLFVRILHHQNIFNAQLLINNDGAELMVLSLILLIRLVELEHFFPEKQRLLLGLDCLILLSFQLFLHLGAAANDEPPLFWRLWWTRALKVELADEHRIGQLYRAMVQNYETLFQVFHDFFELALFLDTAYHLVNYFNCDVVVRHHLENS
jgi:hypothetical protein